MTEAFNRSRRMWAVVNGQLLIAEPNDPQSHIEWLSSLGHREVFSEITRGYLRDGVLVAYKPSEGNDFSRWIDLESVKLAYHGMKDIQEIHEIWLGVSNPGLPGYRAQPVVVVREHHIPDYIKE